MSERKPYNLMAHMEYLDRPVEVRVHHQPANEVFALTIESITLFFRHISDIERIANQMLSECAIVRHTELIED